MGIKVVVDGEEVIDSQVKGYDKGSVQILVANHASERLTLPVEEDITITLMFTQRPETDLERQEYIARMTQVNEDNSLESVAVSKDSVKKPENDPLEQSQVNQHDDSEQTPVTPGASMTDTSVHTDAEDGDKGADNPPGDGNAISRSSNTEDVLAEQGVASDAAIEEKLKVSGDDPKPLEANQELSPAGKDAPLASEVEEAQGTTTSLPTDIHKEPSTKDEDTGGLKSDKSDGPLNL